MKNPPESLARHKSEEYCYLTTTGRVTGRPHETSASMAGINKVVGVTFEEAKEINRAWEGV